jgi:hypothetical protein
MTGGSRNILDLSKTSLLEFGDPTDIFHENGKPFISGGVKFFGLEPADRNQLKDITLNFEGVNYSGNSIIYAEDNGSWRLQIKGKSSSGEGITEVFNRLNIEEGERYNVKNELLLYLQYKIITFTKIQMIISLCQCSLSLSWRVSAKLQKFWPGTGNPPRLNSLGFFKNG